MNIKRKAKPKWCTSRKGRFSFSLYLKWGRGDEKIKRRFSLHLNECSNSPERKNNSRCILGLIATGNLKTRQGTGLAIWSASFAVHTLTRNFPRKRLRPGMNGKHQQHRVVRVVVGGLKKAEVKFNKISSQAPPGTQSGRVRWRSPWRRSFPHPVTSLLHRFAPLVVFALHSRQRSWCPCDDSTRGIMSPIAGWPSLCAEVTCMHSQSPHTFKLIHTHTPKFTRLYARGKWVTLWWRMRKLGVVFAIHLPQVKPAGSRGKQEMMGVEEGGGWKKAGAALELLTRLAVRVPGRIALSPEDKKEKQSILEKREWLIRFSMRVRGLF